MARPKKRPDTIQKPLRLDGSLCGEVDAERGDQPFTHVVEEGLRLWLKAKKRRAKAAA